jgi:hypothetical protein
MHIFKTSTIWRMKMVDVVYVQDKCICDKLKKEGQGRIIRPLRSKVFISFALAESWAGYVGTDGFFIRPPWLDPTISRHEREDQRDILRHGWRKKFPSAPRSSQYPGADLPPLA